MIAQSLFGQLGDFGIGVRKIGIVDVLGNKTLVAMFALVAVSVIAILPTFDDRLRLTIATYKLNSQSGALPLLHMIL